MKHFLIVFFMTVSLTVLGQTKQETQTWISEKLELYGYSDDIEITYYYSATYTDTELIVTDKLVTNIMNIKSSIISTYTIPIKSMNKLRFEQKENNTWMYISIKGNQNLIKSSSSVDNKIKYVSTVPILLSNSIKENDLKNRMNKAFIHLIKLYGGSLIEEKF